MLWKRTPRIIRRAFLGVAGVALVLLVVLLAIKWWSDAHYYDGYDGALPLNVTIREEAERQGYLRTEFMFDGLAGQPVPAILITPKSDDEPWPCAVFLHGIGQKKEYVDKIAQPLVDAGFALATFDQYTKGERRLDDPSPLDELIALRRRGALTVNETRRLVDFLQTRPDIAHDRIYMLGASYGAITGSTAVAFEKRIRAAVLCYGGGDLPVLLASDAVRNELGAWATGLVTPIAAFLLSPADPIHHVAGIASRPVLFQNGKHDCLIPIAAAQALFDAAQEPKEILWYDSDHVGLDPEHTAQVLDDAVAWLLRQEASQQPSAAT